MKNTIQRLRVSTPGRICLFGEHQDYLQLPVISCAISLRIAIAGTRRNDMEVFIDMPDISSSESFSLRGKLDYIRERDYFRSAVNVLRRHGFSFSHGFDCVVRGEIPINAGTSSSSALIVSWVNFLAQMSDQGQKLAPHLCAQMAHEAEVLEFGEPGGMMDHYATAFGGALALEFSPTLKVGCLDAPLRLFVLGDSNEPKDTRGVLSRVKNLVLDVVDKLAQQAPAFALQTAPLGDIEGFADRISPETIQLLRGTIRNRDITAEARKALTTRPLDHRVIGILLNEHQAVLREVLQISSPKIDGMIDAALAAGAYGAKINGSGGGGCMFAYAPDNPEKVADAIARAGGTAYIVHIDVGTHNEAVVMMD